MANFKRNYLPSQSRPWAKQVEDVIEATERTLKSLDVNNRSKDEQFAASLSRLDAAVISAINASALADAAQDEAITANSVAVQAGLDATEALQDIIDLGNPGGPTINASNINAGTLTGVLFRTAAAGTRVETTSSSVNFYGPSSLGGSITGNYGGQNAVVINSAGYLVLDGNVIINSGLAVTGGNLVANDGNISTVNTLSGGTISSSGTISGGTISGSSVSGGTVSASTFSGTSNPSIGQNSTSSFAGNLFINTSGSMFRSTETSSREAKENIESFEFDTDAFIAVSPVTFNYKSDAVSREEETEIKQLGFILEDFEDAGLGEHLVIPVNELDKYKGLRYNKLYMMLHKVVQAQDETIKNLTARIEALESN
jgi:hypothetical protein